MRSPFEFGSKRHQQSRRTYGVDFDAAISQILRVSRQTKPLRRSPREIAIPHPLHHTGDIVATRLVWVMHC